MIHEPQRVALPAVLRQGLTVFREAQGNQQKYRIRDNWKGQTCQLESWQFFVLEVLPVCNDFPKLASVFEDRFGRPITTGEVEELFSVVEEMKLFGLSADAHPLVAAFYKKKGIQLVLKTASAQTAEAAETKGNGGNGKGNGKGKGGALSGAGTAMEHAADGIPGASSVAVVFNNSDFTVHEFKMQNKDIQKLCRAIKSEGYKLDVKAPENSVEWLNAVLQTPDFYDQAAARKPKMKLNEAIRKLKEQTEKTRKAYFKDLKIDEQNAIRRMNRLLMELLYSETPRGFSPDDSTAEDEISWKLFNPTELIKRIHPFLSPLKYAVYMVPVLALAAFFTGIHHSDLIANDFSRMGWTSAANILASMLTINLLAVLVTALTAYSYRATVNSFGIMLLFRFFPLFSLQIGHTQQLSRRERIWLFAAPILARGCIASLGLLLWFGTRAANGFLPDLALTVGVIGAAILFLDANPLMKSSGSRLLGAVLNEPNLRFKAYLALANKLRGDVYRKTDTSVLAAYALASSLFMVATVTVFLLLFGNMLKLHLGGAGIFLVVLVIMLLLLRLTQQIKYVVASHDRIAQFERWRTRTLPSAQPVSSVEKENRSSVMSPVQWLVVGSIVAGLFVPYHYEPGGNFVLLPNQKAELTTETGGIIRRVYFNGGELLQKGTVVAKLSTTDYEGQVKIYEAKMREQQAIVDDLKSRPTSEEANLAKQALEVRKREALFSGQKLKRLETLYRENTISLEEFEDQRKQAEVDAEQVKEYRAKLELTEAGATDEEIAAAEARLQSYREERDYYKEKINQSTIAIPFDGRLEGVNLKLKAGHFLNKGELFAVAQNTGQIVAEIEVPEPDIAYIRTSSNIRLRPLTYSDTDFTGTVTAIDAGITEKASGRVVKVVTLLDNKDDLLKSGMTGYAKISAENVPIGKVLSRSVVRFFEVEVWSWLP